MSDPNTSDQTGGAAKPKRLFRVLFALSVALNLLVVFAVIGVFTKGPGARGGPPGLREISAPYVGAFERADKRAMRAQMRERLPGRSAGIAANKADYSAFLAIVRAEEFDAPRAAMIMEGQMARVADLQKLGREMALARIAAMSLPERRAYADRLQDWLDHKAHKRGKPER